MNATLGSAVLTVLLLLRVEAGERKMLSKFTSTARSHCISYRATGESGDPGFEARCRGLGGYELEFLGGDERSWINVKYGKGESVDLYTATMGAIEGTFPHKENDAVEWRGLDKNGRFVPCAIIYRLAAGNDETRKIHTCLVVIKLARAQSKVIGSANGKNEEAEAHRIADAACSSRP